jgi:zinc transporter, ZIP family
VRGAAVMLVAAAAAAAAGCGGGDGDELAVTQSTLQPGEITLVVENHSNETAHVEQVILNDAFVDFRASTDTVPPGDVEAVVVLYPWIEGESYELELLTTTGATVDYEIEDAEAA